MIKVLMLRSNPFEPDERVLKEAQSLLKNGYRVTLLCWDRELKFPEKEDFKGIKIERIRLRAGYGSIRNLIFKMPLFWIKTFIRGWSKDFDVIHCYDYDTLPPGVWLKILKGKKLVYDALELFLSYTSNQAVNQGMFLIERLQLPFIDALIYTNHERLKVFLEKTGLKKKTVIIHNYPQLGLKIGEKKGINPDRKVIFQYNGGVKQDRNLINILKAFKKLKDTNNKNFNFLIIGNHHNPYGNLLKEYVKKNQMEEQIIFHEFIPLPDLLELLQKTQIGFVPLVKDSLNNLIPEPNKLYNYFATGNFAVVEDTPYLEKIVKKQGLGLTCNFSDVQEIKKRIEWVLENQQQVIETIEKAYQKYLQEYNWESQEKVLIELYNNLINK